MNIRIPALAIALTAPALAGALPSFEESLAPPPPDSEWHLHIATYAWLQALDGDVTVAGTTSALDLSFSDIADYLDMGLMGAVGVQYDRWGFLVDFNYADLSANIPTPLGIVAPFIAYDQEQWLVNGVVSYTAIHNETTSLDVFAGARLNAIKVDLGINAVTLTSNQDWLDPIIGLRFQQAISESLFLRLVGDIGGFGLSSDFTWQAMGVLGWRFRDNGSFILGYRAIDTDYSQGTFAYDINAHGPLLGIELQF